VFHRDWINVDAFPAAPGILVHDLHRALPFPDARFDGVYASHVLEHLEPDAGLRLLRECNRVLNRNGIIRVAVPDLETIAKLYLESLAGAQRGERDADRRYDWMMLELYDQTVRAVSGGRMAAYMATTDAEKQAGFLKSRIGDHAVHRSQAEVPEGAPAWWTAWRRFRASAMAMRKLAAETFALLFLGRQGVAALREGLFRRSGEVHRWMYDRYSLARILEQAGFTDVRVCGAGESSIPDFARFGLELRDGQPRKPDSIYVEGRKPGT
jgi:predicted SAM-dependent methyltransferase